MCIYYRGAFYELNEVGATDFVEVGVVENSIRLDTLVL
jgi:hypothetical protein